MAKYSNTKAKINEKITTNGAQSVTGSILNDVLQTMVDSLGADYQFGGLVQPGSSFTAGEQPVVFLATTPGTYTNFGGLVVADGEVALLVWSGSAWSKQTPDISTRTELNQLGQAINKLDSSIVPLTLEQGGLYYDGGESSDPNYVRNDGFILPPFSLSVNNGFTIIQVNLYNPDGTVNKLLTNLGSSYEYSGDLRARVVLCKVPLAIISPSEYNNIINNFDSQGGKLSIIKKEIDALEDTVYGAQEFILEQGGIYNTGDESSDPNYVRNKGFIYPPFSVSVNSGYTIAQVNLYNENDTVVEMRLNLGSSYSYNGNYKARVVFCKKPLAIINPTEYNNIIDTYQITPNGLHQQIETLEEDIYGKTKLIFEQGGLWNDGSESSSTNYVRNKGYIDQSFSISVKSGYIINQYNLYDENGIHVSMRMLGGTSFSYNGEYKVRLVFCKDPLATIDPTENFIYEFKADGLLDRVTDLESKVKNNILIAHSLQSIDVNSPQNYNFCFFDKLMRVSYTPNDPKLNKTGLWSDGIVWRNIVDNNLFVTAYGFKTIKISDEQAIVKLEEERVDRIHSVTKLMNLVIVCDSGIDLNTKVTVNAEDKSTSLWYDGYVDVGDEVTIYDLMCSTVIISDNCAANVLARVVGYLLNPSAASDSEARTSFIAAMNAKAQSLGMTNTDYRSTFGSIAFSTPTDQCKLAKEIYTNQAYTQITNKWGLLSYQMTITGTNARTYIINNEINEYKRTTYLPGFIGGKPGQGSNGTLLFVWQDENNVVYASFIANSVLYNGDCCYQDARRVIDYSKEYIE